MRVLVVAQLAPPSTLTAARRTAGLVKQLGRLGHEVTLLTSALSGTGAVEGATRVERSADLMASRLNWRRGNMAAMEGGGSARYSPPSRLERVLVPDPSILTWVPIALTQALRLPRPQAVVTTGPPQSVHLVGLALRRRGVPWVMDVRDGWTFEPPHPPFPTSIQRRADAALERTCARGADACVGVTGPIAADLHERLGARAERITNGFDPDEDVAPIAGDLLRDDRFELVHTGRATIAGRTPEPLLRALRPPDELVMAGPLSHEDERLLAAYPAVVRHVGALERPRTLALQRAADLLVVIAAGSLGSDVATGKLYEYLAARRPVLVVGDGNEAARIVAETGAGLAAPAEPGALGRAVERLRDFEPAGRNLGRYSWPNLGERYAELLESVASTARQ